MSHLSNKPVPTNAVRLRTIELDDLPTLYQNQLDPDGNRMAFMRPRTRSDFKTHWDKILSDHSVTVRAVMVGDQLGGCITCFQVAGRSYVGYWIGKSFWGQGVATRALELLLHEVSTRPLHAQVAITNVASQRVLEKCGFSTIGYERSPGSDHLVECEEVILELT